MPTIKRFEDLHCWQLAEKCCLEIYRHTRKGSWQKDFAFRDQIRRAALSIMNNIAEGHGRFSDKAFIYFLEIANASCSEVRSMVRLARKLDYLSANDTDSLHEVLSHTQAKILSLVRYLKRSSVPVKS